MKLFDDKFRDNYDRATSGENLYNYYDNNEQFHIVKVRELLNKWFDNYPLGDRDDLKNTFKNHFHNGFYELFIHELFFKQGFMLEPHPLIEGSIRKPDFLASKGNQKFYIEATTVSYYSDEELKKEKVRENFIDELDKMNTPNFWLGLEELKFKTEKSPKVAKLRLAIEQKLSTIDHVQLEKIERSSIKAHNLEYQDEQVFIKVRLYIKSEAAKNAKDFRPIGFRSSAVTIQNADDDSNKIFRSFKDKATRYGKLQFPYLVCLNIDFQFNIIHDVNWAFHESKIFTPINPKFTRVSAVLITKVNTGEIYNLPDHRLIINPQSSRSLDIDNLQLSYENDSEVVNRKDIDELLELGGQKFKFKM